MPHGLSCCGEAGQLFFVHGWIDIFKNELLILNMIVQTTSRKGEKAILEGTSV